MLNEAIFVPKQHSLHISCLNLNYLKIFKSSSPSSTSSCTKFRPQAQFPATRLCRQQILYVLISSLLSSFSTSSLRLPRGLLKHEIHSNNRLICFILSMLTMWSFRLIVCVLTEVIQFSPFIISFKATFVLPHHMPRFPILKHISPPALVFLIIIIPRQLLYN